MSCRTSRADPWTHIVLAVGTNDIKNFHSLPRFKKEFGGLLYALRAKWPEARIVWQPVIALTDVPALPSALARSARNPRRARSTRWATRLCLERGACRRRGSPSPTPLPAFRATVSMPREAGYRAWAEHLLPFVLGERST